MKKIKVENTDCLVAELVIFSLVPEIRITIWLIAKTSTANLLGMQALLA